MLQLNKEIKDDNINYNEKKENNTKPDDVVKISENNGEESNFEKPIEE